MDGRMDGGREREVAAASVVVVEVASVSPNDSSIGSPARSADDQEETGYHTDSEDRIAAASTSSPSSISKGAEGGRGGGGRGGSRVLDELVREEQSSSLNSSSDGGVRDHHLHHHHHNVDERLEKKFSNKQRAASLKSSVDPSMSSSSSSSSSSPDKSLQVSSSLSSSSAARIKAINNLQALLDDTGLNDDNGNMLNSANMETSSDDESLSYVPTKQNKNMKNNNNNNPLSGFRGQGPSMFGGGGGRGGGGHPEANVEVLHCLDLSKIDQFYDDIVASGASPMDGVGGVCGVGGVSGVVTSSSAPPPGLSLPALTTTSPGMKRMQKSHAEIRGTVSSPAILNQSGDSDAISSGRFREDDDDDDDEDDEAGLRERVGKVRDDADSGHQSDSGKRRKSLAADQSESVINRRSPQRRSASEDRNAIFAGNDEMNKKSSLDGNKRSSLNGKSSKQNDNDNDVNEDKWGGEAETVVREEEPSSPSTSVSRNEQRDTAYGTDEEEEDGSTGTYSWGPMKMAAMSGLTLTTPDVAAPILAEKKKNNSNSSSSSAPPTDERIRELESKINGGQVFAEFEKIPRKRPPMLMDATTAAMEENESRNRFKDVFPYEDTRVKLKPTGSNPNGYINASHIKIAYQEVSLQYIAAQAPMGNTVSSWWSLIWENNVRMVAMLTDIGGQGSSSSKSSKTPPPVLGTSKSFPYFPDSVGPKNKIKFGEYQVTLQNSNEAPSYVTRCLLVKNIKTKEERKIWHLQLVDWPDHGCPEDVHSFLAYIEELESIRRLVGAEMDEQRPKPKSQSASRLPSTGRQSDKKLTNYHSSSSAGGGGGTSLFGGRGSSGNSTGSRKSDHFGSPKSTLASSAKSAVESAVQPALPPTLVHCTAGVGRSGVLILTEVMMACLEQNLKIDVPKALLYIRQQRMLMVQTLGQYSFVYRALIQHLRNSRLI